MARKVSLTPEQVAAKIEEMMKPVHQQIMMCDNEAEVVMFACGMLAQVKMILDQYVGIDARLHVMSMYADPLNPLDKKKRY